jgi:hypothetical protein
MASYHNFSHDAVILCFNIHSGFICFLHKNDGVRTRTVLVGRCENLLTISRMMSPVENFSPSFFFHDAIPPSVMVGDMAGIRKFDVAVRMAEACNSVSNMG